MGEIIQKIILPEELTADNRETIKIYNKRIKHLKKLIKAYESEVKRISSIMAEEWRESHRRDT